MRHHLAACLQGCRGTDREALLLFGSDSCHSGAAGAGDKQQMLVLQTLPGMGRQMAVLKFIVGYGRQI